MPETPLRRVADPSRQAPELKRLPVAPAVSADGTIEGYASLFDVVDLGRDRVARGAFAASLARRGARGVRFLFQHDPAEPIGAWESLAEDRRGLRVRGRLNMGVARAREVHALLRQGGLDGLSIGFRPVRHAREPGGVRRLVEVDLWEISVVTFPMLPDARVGAVKGSAPPVQNEVRP
ncbi:HK97 family phage prohead protease [Methylopila sp. 73B]|uniref:HK97 family phage prohead protease n=1 Tax=Methylopila sp. 73B TaxID=1120792 RepID=UPI0012DF7AED|nr:HK97 family phage prohead protease [Methylopila sp. 73B]